MDTVFNYCDPNHAFFSSDERKWINRIKKLIEQYPEQIRVVALPETNDGCIYVELPSEWLKVQPKKKVSMTDERKQKLAEQLNNARKKSSVGNLDK